MINETLEADREYQKAIAEFKRQAIKSSDCIDRQAAIDAFDGVKVDEENCTEYDIGYNDGIDFAISKLSVLPPAQPEQRTEALKAEIRRMKRAFKTCINSDYYTGYMSALSAVEGYIAKMEGDAE